MSEEVLFSLENHCGFITLNRPSALNALSLNMILLIQHQLTLWNHDPKVHAIIVQANSEKAFCAGGDIRSLYYSRTLDLQEKLQFFWHEYRLNYYIYHLKKPYIALMDGIVMGGGVGISLHGSHPIGSERFLVAMPETTIGFFPDIGASHLLTQCPGALGNYLGLTGNHLNAQEALNAGLIKKIMLQKHYSEFIGLLYTTDLSENAFEKVDHCLQKFESPTVATSLDTELIDRCFWEPEVESIFENLSANAINENWLETLQRKSPISLKVTLKQLSDCSSLSLGDCLQMDYQLVSHFLQGEDFYEGVRALLVDKDRNPKWQYDDICQVRSDEVNSYFKPQMDRLDWIV